MRAAAMRRQRPESLSGEYVFLELSWSSVFYPNCCKSTSLLCIVVFHSLVYLVFLQIMFL